MLVASHFDNPALDERDLADLGVLGRAIAYGGGTLVATRPHDGIRSASYRV